ncbi:MAG TPA: hypothetical protein VM840_05450 [Actinomycetota bacterium]|nr:hypothetical protein [Actinomycetota bacterium]
MPSSPDRDLRDLIARSDPETIRRLMRDLDRMTIRQVPPPPLPYLRQTGPAR